MKYLKEKIFKFKKWLIGFLIPIAIAVPLAALPPDTTEYRFVLSRANDYFDCSSFSENERELCNKKKAEENFIKYPEYYKDYFENKSKGDGRYYYTTRKNIGTATLEEAKNILKQNKQELVGSSIEAKSLLGNFVEIYPAGEVQKEADGFLIATNNQKRIARLTSLIFNKVYATFPSDDFEDYSTGDLSGQNFGTGWSGAWGATTCNVSYDIQTTTVQAGLQAIGSTGSAGCDRNFTANSTDGQVMSYYANNGQTNLQLDFYVRQIGVGIQLVMQLTETGNIAVYDNLTQTTIQAYNANQWYQIEHEATYTGETHRVRIDGGSWSSVYNMYNYTVLAHTQSDRVEFQQSSSNVFRFDTMTDNTPAAATASWDSGAQVIFHQ